MPESDNLESGSQQPLAKKAKSHYDIPSSNFSQKTGYLKTIRTDMKIKELDNFHCRVNSKKKERQQRYRDRNREKLTKSEAERRKRKQYLQSIAGPSTSSNINRIKELNNEKIIDAHSQSSSGVEGTDTLLIQGNEYNKEKIFALALQKRRERQQRYRQKNREKLKQSEAERRQRLKTSESITKSSERFPNKMTATQALFFMKDSLRPEALRLKKTDKTHSRKSFTRTADVEKSSTNHADSTSVTGSILIQVEAEEGGGGSPEAAAGEAGPLRGAGAADVKVELFDVEEGELTCDQRDDDGGQFHFNSLRNEGGTINDARQPDARQIPRLTRRHYKCSACGGLIEGFRYACVQCANYEQCAECEASGAHAEHYVLRVSRVERAGEVHTVLDRVRRDLAQLNIPLQVKLEKDDKEEEVGEEEILVLKSEPVELRVEVDPLQCAGPGAGAGGGAVKPEVIDTEDSDMTPYEVPVIGPPLTGEVSHIEAGAGDASRPAAGDQFPEGLRVWAGGSVSRQGVIDTDEDFFMCNKVPVIGPPLTGEVSHIEAGDQFPEGLRVWAGGSASPQKVIDTDEDLFMSNKVRKLQSGTTDRSREPLRGCSTLLEPVTEHRRKARENNEQRHFDLTLEGNS